MLALAIGKDSHNYAIVSWEPETLVRLDQSDPVLLNRRHGASMHD